MGFWSKLFGKREVVPERLARAELERYCKGKFEVGLRAFVEQKRRSLQELGQCLKESCDTLEHAELRNPNIPPRALQIMEGNRTEFLKKSRLRFDELRSRLDDSSSSEQVIQIGADITKLLADLADSTKRQYAVLQEFFADETRAVMRVLSDLQELASRLQGVANEEFVVFERVLGLIDEKKQAAERRMDFETQMQENKEEQIRLKRSLKRAAKERMQVERSVEFAELGRLKKELEGVRAQKKQVEKQVFEKLAPLSRALKKFAKVSMDAKTADALAKDQLSVFVLDVSSVYSVLTSLRRNLVENKIGIKAPEKSVAILKDLDKNWLVSVQEEHAAYEKQIGRLQDMINANQSDSRIDELDHEESKLQDHIERIESVLAECARLAEQSNAKAIDARIEQTLKEQNIVLS